MKKTIKTTRNSKKQVKENLAKFEPKRPVIKFDLNNIETYDDLVLEISTAKINGGYSIDVSEFARIIQNEEEGVESLISELAQIYNNDMIARQEEIAKLKEDLAWATSPWYKKLFTKKPNK